MYGWICMDGWMDGWMVGEMNEFASYYRLSTGGILLYSGIHLVESLICLIVRYC